MNEVEAEQATRTVATDIKPDQLIDWMQYSGFDENINIIAYCTRFKKTQTVHLKAGEIHQADNFCFDLFKMKASRMFQINNK